MARAMGLPAVLGVAGLVGTVRPGDVVIVDGSAGKVVVRPTATTLEAYERRRVEFVREQRQLARLAKLPAVTRDGVEVTLQANIELPREIDAATTVGAAGVGLLRTEFMFMNRDDVPDEDEQLRLLLEIIKGMDGKPVTIRTLDVGGEKLAAALGVEAPGANPALGLRAIRLGLQRPELLETQFAAILRAATHGPVRILLPMIATVSEVQEVRAILAKVARRLLRKGVRIPDALPPLGAMIEIPGAALAADALAQVCDFFAIGTNDLTMYTLAIDRGDEQVAHLYNPLHPAVLRLIQFTTEAALRNRIAVSLCGEIAGDPRYTALLLGLGIRDLSMSPIKLPRIKQRVRSIELAAAATRARAIMDQSDQGRISALLDDFNALR
jgi:phosphotransferase system enzyme I (PtsI)